MSLSVRVKAQGECMDSNEEERYCPFLIRDISVISKLLSNDILDFENYMSTNFALRTPDLPLYESASFI